MNYALRHGVTLKLTSGSSNTRSAAFTDGTEYVRVVSTIACHIAVGVAPTAAVTTPLLPAMKLKLLKYQLEKK